jgi:putative glycerol-1-phosphate prenyltransferase
MNIFNDIISRKGNKLALLIDPDKTSGLALHNVCSMAEQSNIDIILVGGSILWHSTEQTVAEIKRACSLPVVLFPGNSFQVCANADGILFMSLISGRNADFLIGQQVLSAPVVKQTALEVISTGYMLFETGKQTSVEYMSNTKPLPSNKPDIAVATALAGEMLGMKMLYLEGGSGAESCLCSNTIQAIRQNVKLPLMVGGGIRTIEHMQKAFAAGADIVVLGTIIEEQPEMIKQFGKLKIEKREDAL